MCGCAFDVGLQRRYHFSSCWETKTAHNEKVDRNRQILIRIIKVIKLIGKRGLSFSGKQYESAKLLLDTNLDHGNLLQILLLLSEFDPVLQNYIEEISTLSKNSQLRLTLLSKTTINYLIDIMANLIKKQIVAEVCEAKMFSIEIDSTQDISVADQMTIILRYMPTEGKIPKERLFSVVQCKSSTGMIIKEQICENLRNTGIDLKYLIWNSTDGAANMQGTYNGFSSHLSLVVPEQIHIWCYAHILNLVMVDTTSKIIEVSNLFSLLNLIAAFIKESYKRMDIWAELVKESGDTRRLNTIGTTR